MRSDMGRQEPLSGIPYRAPPAPASPGRLPLASHERFGDLWLRPRAAVAGGVRCGPAAQIVGVVDSRSHGRILRVSTMPRLALCLLWFGAAAVGAAAQDVPTPEQVKQTVAALDAAFR